MLPAPTPRPGRLAAADFQRRESAPSERASLWDAWHAKTWADVADVGRVVWTAERGWHIEFRSVWYPGADNPRRVRVMYAEQYGRIDSEGAAQRVLETIRDKHRTRPLYDVLAEYKTAAEDMVPARYAAQFLAAKKVAADRKEITADRYRALAGLHGRGYLEFWKACPVAKINGPGVQAWYEWLRSAHTHLGDGSIRHLLRDFRAFCGYMRKVGALKDIPEFPRIRVRETRRRVPDQGSLAKVLDEIPEAERGLFLARSYAGLRPAEGRRLDVRDYKAGVMTVRAEVSKTGETRVLEIATVAPILDAWIQKHRKGATPWEPLFPAPRARDKRWRATPERRVWCEALRAAGLEHIAPNMGGRHAFATHEIAGGTDAYALKDWMGHASLQTTQRYVDVDAVSLARRMRPVPAAQRKPAIAD